MSDFKLERRPLLKHSTSDALKRGTAFLAILFGAIAPNFIPENELTQEEKNQGTARYYEQKGCNTQDFLRGGLVDCPDSLENEQ